ncbi:MAG TPA: alpha/beta fold hydrolase [Steroidobacteraceae bacterium]|nr:alpha/beta fold hydrolase [Steroidobacteraceae bacterium]
MNRWLKRAGVALAVLALGIGIGAWTFASRLTASANRPVQLPADFPATAVAIPGDGHAVAASWRDLGAATPAVLLVHGMGGDRRSTLPRARVLVDAGFSVLMIDLQAHGETPGERITLGWRESADVRAAVRWLRARTPGRRVGLVGVSLGGAAALIGGDPGGAGRIDVDALVLEAVHPRLRQAIRNRVGPVLTPLLMAQIGPRLHVDADRLDPVDYLPALRAPVLVVGGELDAYTYAAESREMFVAARPPKELWIVPHATHEDFSRVDPRGYREHVVGFLRRWLAPAGAATG